MKNTVKKHFESYTTWYNKGALVLKNGHALYLVDEFLVPGNNYYNYTSGGYK